MQELRNSELPDFIVKSTLGVSFIAAVVLTPFAFLSFFQDRYFLGITILLILTFCSMNVWFGLQNRYHNSLNLFGALLLTVTTALALYQLGIKGSYWASVAVLSFYFILPEKQAWIINAIFVAAITPIALYVLEPQVAFRFFATLLAISLFAFTSTREIYKQNYLLTEQSITDILTGLYNRALLQSSLENAIHQNDRLGTDMTILMLDIDHFKAINDQFGHDIGDSVLKATGEFLNNAFRASDMVFRVGGEEFLALMLNTDINNALKIAEKIRKEFVQLPLIPNHIVTISIGISHLKPDMDWKQWMKQGDENLYKAKSNGRNKVVA